MLNITMEHKNHLFEKAAEDNKRITDDLLSLIRGTGNSGEKQITLFVQKATEKTECRK